MPSHPTAVGAVALQEGTGGSLRPGRAGLKGNPLPCGPCPTTCPRLPVRGWGQRGPWIRKLLSLGTGDKGDSGSESS